MSVRSSSGLFEWLVWSGGRNTEPAGGGLVAERSLKCECFSCGGCALWLDMESIGAGARAEHEDLSRGIWAATKIRHVGLC